MALNKWSRRSIALAIVLCAIGGFMVGSSSSQVSVPDLGNAPRERQHEIAAGRHPPEAGRYQMVAGHYNTYIIFDTATAQHWTSVQVGTAAGVPNFKWEKRESPVSQPAQ